MKNIIYSRPTVRMLVLTSLMGLVACANVQMPTPVASVTNHEKIRSANLNPTQVGEFKLAPGKPASMDTSLSGLRGSSVAPSAGSFSRQLREELIVELKGAGLLDPSSAMKIEGELTDSMVDAAIGTGKGRLAARFKVTRDGRSVFDKELSVEASWESSFMGAVAVPTAINQYSALYKALVGKLLDDMDFRTAMRNRQ
jgi:hypothetical protein